MTQIIKFATFFLIVVFVFASCKKDKVVTSPQVDKTCMGIGIATEFYFDITLNSTFSFIRKYNDPWDYGAPTGGYYNLTSIEGKGIFQPLGEFNIYVKEYADTTALSNIIYSNYIQISKGNINPIYVSGNCSINFKKLIREGGGTLNGTFTITSGSAQACNANVFTSLPPLTVTGNLDLATQTVTLRIIGRVYF